MNLNMKKKRKRWNVLFHFNYTRTKRSRKFKRKEFWYWTKIFDSKNNKKISKNKLMDDYVKVVNIIKNHLELDRY